MRKFYNQAFVVLLVLVAGVAVTEKVNETARGLREATREINRQLVRSGYGVLSTGESLTGQFRRVEFERAPQRRPCPRSS
jgi:hypothetical protein